MPNEFQHLNCANFVQLTILLSWTKKNIPSVCLFSLLLRFFSCLYKMAVKATAFIAFNIQFLFQFVTLRTTHLSYILLKRFLYVECHLHPLDKQDRIGLTAFVESNIRNTHRCANALNGYCLQISFNKLMF